MSILLKNYPDVFCDNKYLYWYERLVSISTIIGVTEKHHIVPKSIIKNDFLVSLTLRQHYIAHLLLTKCVNLKYRNKMLYAITAMKLKIAKNIKFNSRIFEKLKNEANIARSNSLKGRTHSDETKLKIKAKRALQITTEETRNKMSASRKGKPKSSEHIEKMRQIHLGSKRSEETKQKLTESRKHYPRLTCEHCGKIIITANYNRWHGPKCKRAIVNGAD